jgi:hypothetical protein
LKINIPKLSITYLAISSLKRNPNNSRTHSKRQIRQLAESIKEFSFTHPIIIDNNNMIVAGGGRVLAADVLGMDEVPTVRLEHLSPDQIRAYAIADNQLAALAGWDEEILATELQYLLTLDGVFDATITGFEVPEIDLLLSEQDDKPDPDDSFEIADTAPAVTQPGILWELGKHRVLCASALEPRSYSR